MIKGKLLKNHIQWKLILIIAAIAFFSYINTLGHDWTFDDHEYITNNEYVKNPWRVADIFTTTYIYGVNSRQTGLYRPVTIFSYALNNAVTGLRPSLFHLVNNLTHTINSVLVLVVLAAIFGRIDMAFFAALLFAIHPVHTEAVNNVVGRAELLSFLFMMLSLWLYVIRDRNQKLFYPLALFCFMLALMCKEIPAVLPFVILLEHAGRWVRGKRRHVKRDVFETAGFFAIFALYMVIRNVAVNRCGPVPEIMFNDNPLAGLPFLERLPTALTVIVKYCMLLVFPLRLSADYSFNQIPMVGTMGNHMTVFGALFIVVTAAVGMRAITRSHTLYFGVLVLSLPFLVMSNIVFPIGTIMGERLLYIPSLGFSVILACAVLWICREALKSPRFSLWTVCIITVLYAGRTLARNSDWKDNAAIFTKTAQTSPMAVKNSYNYALVLKREGRLREAITEYRKAVSIWSGHQRAWYNLGNALAENKQFIEAADAYKRSLEILPDDPGALRNLALTYKELQQPEKAVETFEKILDIRPDDIKARQNIGNIWVQFKNYDRALAVFEENVRINPKDAGSMTNIGNIYLIRGDTLRAENSYRLSLDIEPQNPITNNLLLELLILQNRISDAEEKINEMKKNNISIRKILIQKIMNTITIMKKHSR